VDGERESKDAGAESDASGDEKPDLSPLPIYYDLKVGPPPLLKSISTG
jgi:hypothetical protein